MKPRLVATLMLVASLALLLTVSTAAQGRQSENAAAVAPGQPGLSFRYVQTLGATEVAYFEDTTHINYPYGVGTDGTNVWIADSNGLRALKYSSTGAFIKQIGKAGFRNGAGTNIDLDWIADVAVDGSGNIWVVDGSVQHVVKFDSSGNYVSKLGKSWSSGSANDRFNNPRGVAIDSAGNIYVSDRNNHRIQVFDSSGVYSTTMGVTGSPGSTNDRFNRPLHIAIDSDDNLYVADANNHRIQIFDSSHAWIATIGTGSAGSGANQFDQPLGVYVDASKIYVADRWNHRVQIFDRATRAYQNTIGAGSPGTGNNRFNGPSDVAVDSAGNIYVADEFNSRVQQFNSSLVYQRTYGTTGIPYLTDNYHYHQPTGVAVASDGSIYLTENRGCRLLKLNASGAWQWTVGEAGVTGEDNAHLNEPNDVDLDSSGRVYVADTWNNRVQMFNPDGSYFASLGTGYGTGNYQFNGANGIAVDSAGNIYVADVYNHRVQIYDSSRNYVATLGTTGAPDADNAHFDTPHDVAVDSAGNIYVADNSNHRVQVFNSSRAYVRTIGVTGVSGDDFGHLRNPTAVAVDAVGRIYVADGWGNRVQVFDNSGGYLTTIGGSWGKNTGQMRQTEGLAFDRAGNLYVAEVLNHRFQKFAPGVPGWLQTNINGFGDWRNYYVTTLAVFDGQLYAGTRNTSGKGAQMWRTSDGSAWTAVITNGFGITRNVAIDHLIEFKSNLYAGTWADTVNGGEVWRSSTGNSNDWTRVVSQGFGDTTNGEVFHFGVFSDTLYAATWSYTSTHGGEIWRSDTGDSGDWTRVITNGFGDAANSAALTFEVFNGYLYAGTYNWNTAAMTSTGGEVWRTDDGLAWTQVNTAGFGSVNNDTVYALAAFKGNLYASTSYSGAGVQVWRCQVCDNSDWTQVVDSGWGNSNRRGASALKVFDDRLYLVVGNPVTGMEVWRTSDGTYWEQVGFGGFGDSNNNYPYYDNMVAVFNNRLYIGTDNSANGGEVWLYLHRQVYLPVVLRN